jgi:D-beta-D-heptose 7-phosphate kinase/D-beta-D-heptose 1-phosphate adenosyltransferase
VVELGPLLDALRAERRAGRTLVFTNGCFDLLHAGHLGLLEAAAEQGDRLIVGLNGDASIQRLKGQGRPVMPFAERALVLAGLEAVDWVVGFDEETPLRLIEAIEPDVLVKGADWPPDRIVGREVVEARGGRVVSAPLVEGHSTSRVVERMRARRIRAIRGRRRSAHP